MSRQRVSDLENRYYISSGELTTEAFAAAVRDHCGIQNRLHWSLDAIPGEDDRHLVEDYGAQHFSLLTKMALKLLR